MSHVAVARSADNEIDYDMTDYDMTDYYTADCGLADCEC